MLLALMGIMVCLGSNARVWTLNVANTYGLGPFRRTCEITLGLLRQNEDALMTVLETFLHDPTTDFIGRKVCIEYSNSNLY